MESVFDAAVSDHEAGADDHELENVAAILVSSLVRGFCIGNATELDPEAFLDDIFDVYATDGIMSEERKTSRSRIYFCVMDGLIFV